MLVTVLGPDLAGWPGALLGQPAAWTVPIAFAVMVLGLAGHAGGGCPADVGRTMLQLHAPDVGSGSSA